MSNLKEYIKTLNIDVLNHAVDIIVTNNVKASRDKRNKLLGEVELHPNTRALFSSNGCGYSFIFLPIDVENFVKCHEAYHCVNEMMRFMGANHENEVMAYTLSYIVKEIDSFYKKIKTKGLTKKNKPARVKKVKKN